MNGTVHITRPALQAVNVAEADPTLATDGVRCEGHRHAAVTFTNLNVTNYDLQVWVFDGSAWARASDASGALIDIDGITTTFATTLEIAGFQRVFVQIDNATALVNVDRQYALGRF